MLKVLVVGAGVGAWVCRGGYELARERRLRGPARWWGLAFAALALGFVAGMAWLAWLDVRAGEVWP